MPKAAKPRSPAADPSPARRTEQAHLPIDQRIGAAIRRKRLALMLTLADLASGSDMSAAMLSRIENGQASASLDVLERICTALGVSISMLLSEVENRKGEAQLIKAEDQLEVVRTGTKHGHTYRLLSYHRGPQKLFEPFLIEMDKESESYPRFQHPGTEFIYMLEGEMDYQFGEKRFTLTPGDALTFSGEVEHGPAELRSEKVKFISTIIYAE
jgi:transcriptional regulator with XRE-family HTH domain